MCAVAAKWFFRGPRLVEMKRLERAIDQLLRGIERRCQFPCRGRNRWVAWGRENRHLPLCQHDSVCGSDLARGTARTKCRAQYCPCCIDCPAELRSTFEIMLRGTRRSGKLPGGRSLPIRLRIPGC